MFSFSEKLVRFRDKFPRAANSIYFFLFYFSDAGVASVLFLPLWYLRSAICNRQSTFLDPGTVPASVPGAIHPCSCYLVPHSPFISPRSRKAFPRSTDPSSPSNIPQNNPSPSTTVTLPLPTPSHRTPLTQTQPPKQTYTSPTTLIRELEQPSYHPRICSRHQLSGNRNNRPRHPETKYATHVSDEAYEFGRK